MSLLYGGYLGPAPTNGQNIVGLIAEAIQPFNPGVVDIYVDDAHLSLDSVRVVVQCSLLVDDICTLAANRLMLMEDEFAMSRWVGQEAGKFFRSCMDEPVPSNIILGED